MADIRHQGTDIDDDNDPAPENIPVPGNIPLTKLEKENIWRSEGIIYLRQSNNLHNTNVPLKNYTREKVMNMTKLDLFLILFPVDYLK